jgi:hypothetical protein
MAIEPARVVTFRSGKGSSACDAATPSPPHRGQHAAVAGSFAASRAMFSSNRNAAISLAMIIAISSR